MSVWFLYQHKSHCALKAAGAVFIVVTNVAAITIINTFLISSRSSIKNKRLILTRKVRTLLIINRDITVTVLATRREHIC